MAATSTINYLANPGIFMQFSGKILPWLGLITALTLLYSFYAAFFLAPADYQQGETVRIMFIHVPAAWLALFAYSLMAFSALGTLIWRHPIADVSAKAAAPLGAVFTFIALYTGALWGKPMWGTWWVWDARLTSMFILFLMYLGLIILWRSFNEPAKAAKICAIMTLIGFINIPIIKFSVDWWNTLHQPASIMRFDGPTVHSSILNPLLINIAGFSLFFITLHLVLMRNDIMKRRLTARAKRTLNKNNTLTTAHISHIKQDQNINE